LLCWLAGPPHPPLALRRALTRTAAARGRDGQQQSRDA
jgi:hypothetical protein